MKTKIYGIMGTIAICAVIIAVVFGALGTIVGIEFIASIAYLACIGLAISIFIMIVVWVLSFDWSESPFLKITVGGIIMAVASIIIHAIFEWQIFYTLFVIFSIITGIAIVIGLIKTIFGG